MTIMTFAVVYSRCQLTYIVLLHQDLCLTFDRVWKSIEPVGRACDLGIPLHDPCSELKFSFISFCQRNIIVGLKIYARSTTLAPLGNISLHESFFISLPFSKKRMKPWHAWFPKPCELFSLIASRQELALAAINEILRCGSIHILKCW